MFVVLRPFLRRYSSCITRWLSFNPTGYRYRPILPTGLISVMSSHGIMFDLAMARIFVESPDISLGELLVWC